MGQNHSLKIKRKYYDLIKIGKKTIEVRVGYAQIKKIREGDTITFEEYSNRKYKVVRVVQYADFADMLDHEDSQNIIPGVTKYKALEILQGIYPEEKEALGVYAFQIEQEIGMQIISATKLVERKKYNTFANVVAKAYSVTDCICKDYPNHFNWYWSKTVPAVLKGTREILVCTVEREIAGVAFLKREDGEKKICTFLVLENYRRMGVSTELLKRVFDFLGTTKPLITIADYKLKMFEGIIKKYEWQQTQVLNEGYYNSISREIVFNGKIS